MFGFGGPSNTADGLDAAFASEQPDC